MTGSLDPCFGVRRSTPTTTSDCFVGGRTQSQRERSGDGSGGDGGEGATASVGRWLCLAGGLIGAVGLLDAIARTGLLTAMLPGEPPMKANTGLALLLLGGGGRGPRSGGCGRPTQDAGAAGRICGACDRARHPRGVRAGRRPAYRSDARSQHGSRHSPGAAGARDGAGARRVWRAPPCCSISGPARARARRSG